jgi:hypothetical protein
MRAAPDFDQEVVGLQCRALGTERLSIGSTKRRPALTKRLLLVWRERRDVGHARKQPVRRRAQIFIARELHAQTAEGLG